MTPMTKSATAAAVAASSAAAEKLARRSYDGVTMELRWMNDMPDCARAARIRLPSTGQVW